jgi:hypothetical protein
LRSARNWAAPLVEKRWRATTLSHSVLDTVASTDRDMRRSGAGAKARDKKPSAFVKCDSSGSSSAVGDRLAFAEAEEPVSVAQGLLHKK